MAYPCTSRHISERHDGTFVVVQVSHEIDRHGDRQDYSDDISVHDTAGGAFTASRAMDKFS